MTDYSAELPHPDEDTPAEIEPVEDDTTPEEMQRAALATIIGQACGAVSVCWESMEGTGVFQSDRAKAFVDHAVTEIERIYGDLIYVAWTVIANAGHNNGGWDGQDPEWVEAAKAWRDRFHTHLDQLNLAPHVIYDWPVS